MARSPTNLESFRSGVRDLLSRSLPACIFSDYQAGPDLSPLLIVQTRRIVSGFAFISGNSREQYLVQYHAFKRNYAQMRDAWSSLDISFVVCISLDTDDLQALSSSIETDVFFCRKFVVPVIESVADSLSKLPFLPLSPIDSRPLRPPPAQTLLRLCGVQAELARFLVVQRERSPEGIVEDCLSGKFTHTVPLQRVRSSEPSVRRHSLTTSKIASLSIQNFRAYRKRQTFELGSDVTVLYGPNGFGKTSFFDAIDFALTGEIGRLQSLGAQLSGTTAHLDSESADACEVAVTFKAGGISRRLARSVADPKWARLDGELVDRKSALSQLAGNGPSTADRVDNLINLFRATHLFSHEYQELAKDFRSRCELSSDVVSRLLAFDDYEQAARKTSAVRDTLSSDRSGKEQRASELRPEILRLQRELDYLRAGSQVPAAIDQLDSRLQHLRRNLDEIGIAGDEFKLELSSVRKARALLEALASETNARAARFSAILGRIPELAQLTERAEKLESELDVAQLALERDKASASRETGELTRARARLSVARTARQSLEVKEADLLRFEAEMPRMNADLNRPGFPGGSIT